jgi:DNA-binding protein YbaB
MDEHLDQDNPDAEDMAIAALKKAKKKVHHNYPKKRRKPTKRWMW